MAYITWGGGWVCEMTYEEDLTGMQRVKCDLIDTSAILRLMSNSAICIDKPGVQEVT